MLKTAELDKVDAVLSEGFELSADIVEFFDALEVLRPRGNESKPFLLECLYRMNSLLVTLEYKIFHAPRTTRSTSQEDLTKIQKTVAHAARITIAFDAKQSSETAIASLLKKLWAMIDEVLSKFTVVFS